MQRMGTFASQNKKRIKKGFAGDYVQGCTKKLQNVARTCSNII
jgi:hypothetical protein